MSKYTKSELTKLTVAKLRQLIKDDKLNIRTSGLKKAQYIEAILKASPKTKKTKKTKTEKEEEEGEIVERKGNPLKTSPKPLQKHQVEFIKGFFKSPARGAIAIHGVGSGKTLTAVVSAEIYLQKHPKRKVFILTPASLLGNFKAELYEYNPAIKSDSRYKFYTFDGYSRAYARGDAKTNCENSFMIIDEGQNLRTTIKTSFGKRRFKKKDGTYIEEEVEKVASGAKPYNILEGCGKRADKILILSATPIINNEFDMMNLMAMINGHDTLSQKKYKSILENPAEASKYFNCRLSWFKQPKKVLDEFYPKVEEKLIPLEMKGQLLKDYKEIKSGFVKSEKLIKEFKLENLRDNPEKIKKRLDSFYNGMRRATNALEGLNNPKVKFIIDWVKSVIDKKTNNKIGLTKKILDTHTDKTVIFTHFMDAGTKLITKSLDKANIPYGMITGSVSKTKRTKIVEDYVSGKIKVILISKAGAEGLNLLETGYLFIMEQSWNMSEKEQVKGRAVRFKSHMNLPVQKRNVLIMELFLVSPSDMEKFKKATTISGYKFFPEVKGDTFDSVDMRLFNFVGAKQIRIDGVLEELKKNKPVEKCISAKS